MKRVLGLVLLALIAFAPDADAGLFRRRRKPPTPKGHYGVTKEEQAKRAEKFRKRNQKLQDAAQERQRRAAAARR
jgi:hypothetical protein